MNEAPDPVRTTLAVIMVMDAAIQHLIAQGYDRVVDRISIVDDGVMFPTWLSMRGKRVFKVELVERDGKSVVEGTWIQHESWPKRLWRAIFGGKRDAGAAGGR